MSTTLANPSWTLARDVADCRQTTARLSAEAAAKWQRRMPAIRAAIAAGESKKRIGARYGVTAEHVRKVVREYGQK